MTKYFAYGSNCNPDVMARKGVRFTARRRAVLGGYRLLFNKKSLREHLDESIGYANICPAEDALVEGVLYDLHDDDLDKLDQSERYPDHYNRERVVATAGEVDVECWVYVAREEVTADGLVPSRNYLNHILAGQEFLSRQYYEALDQSQTYSADCVCCGRRGEVLFLRELDRLHTLCQSCREARLKWGDALLRTLTVAETTAIMQELVIEHEGFGSIQELLQEAASRKLIETTTARA